MQKIIKNLVILIRRSSAIWLQLAKVLVPLLIVVEILKKLGIIEVLTHGLTPLMGIVGLPGEAALVLATAIFSSIYGAMAVFVNLFGEHPLSVAQTTVLASMMLIAHSLPVEVGVCKKAGIAIWYALGLRIVGAFIYAILLSQIYQFTGSGLEPAAVLFSAAETDLGIFSWIINQIIQLVQIWAIIFLLLGVIEILKALRLLWILERMLVPIIVPLKLSKSAVPVLVTGLTLGLAYGGGILIDAVKSGQISKRDSYLSIGFLCLCHSLIEDRLLMVLLGGALSAMLIGPFIFAFVIMYLISVIDARIVRIR